MMYLSAVLDRQLVKGNAVSLPPEPIPMNNYIAIRREEGRRGLNGPYIFCSIERVMFQLPLAILQFMLLVSSLIILNMCSIFYPFCSSILYYLHIICLFIEF